MHYLTAFLCNKDGRIIGSKCSGEEKNDRINITEGRPLLLSKTNEVVKAEWIKRIPGRVWGEWETKTEVTLTPEGELTDQEKRVLKVILDEKVFLQSGDKLYESDKEVDQNVIDFAFSSPYLVSLHEDGRIWFREGVSPHPAISMLLRRNFTAEKWDDNGIVFFKEDFKPTRVAVGPNALFFLLDGNIEIWASDYVGRVKWKNTHNVVDIACQESTLFCLELVSGQT
jgi:hypothetical protein